MNSRVWNVVLVSWVLGASVMAASTNVIECTVTEAKGRFHSSMPPELHDTLRIDLDSPHLGDSRTARIDFSREGSTDSPYVYGFAGQVKPQPGEAARYQISWLLPQAHVFITVSVDKSLAAASLDHRYSGATSVELSELKMECHPPQANADTEGKSAEKFDYDCQHRPFTHPFFSRPGVKGVCSAALETATGPRTVKREAKNTLWALFELANELCVNEHHEILGLAYQCEWVPN